MNYRAICLFFIFSCQLIFSQDPHPSFKHYTVKDGLANPDVYQVKQDSKGYIWFATSYGVSRFNGYEFENFTTNEGLPDNTVFEIFEDYSGKIWFVPLSCKLSYYDNGQIFHYRYNDTIQKCLRKQIKTSFYVNEKGTVYLGILNEGIYEITIDGKIKKNHLSGYDKNNNCLKVIEPASGYFIYSFYQGGKFKVLDFDTRFLKAKIPIRKEDWDISTNKIRIIYSRRNKILISFTKELLIIDKTGNYYIEEFPEDITWLYEDKDADLWVGSFLGGVFHIRDFDFEHKKNYLPKGAVDGVWQDSEGGFWFATEGDEVYYTPSKEILTFDEESGLTDNRVNCITNNGNAIYIGTEVGGIVKITSKKGIARIDKKVDIMSGNVSHFFHDERTGIIWISGHRFCGKIINDVLFQDFTFGHFYDALHDTNSSYWLAAGGLFKVDMFRAESKKHHYVTFNAVSLPISVVVKRISSMTKNKDGTLWLGAMDGLWKFYQKDSTVVNWGDYYPLLKNRVLDMIYHQNFLTIATKGAGILLYNGKYVFQVNNKVGLSNDHVHKLLSNGSSVWAATSRGINRLYFDSAAQKLRIVTYSSTDGLPSDEINDIYMLKNDLWVGSTKGLSVFNPDSFKKVVINYPVYIDWVKVNGQKIKQEEKTEFDSDQNITFHYTGLGYRDAGNLNYRYKIIGLDTNWVYTQNREIQFTSLPANKYVFIVQVQKSDGSWSTTEAIYSFIVYAPFWQKWWFSTVIGLIVISIFYFVFRYNFRLKQNRIRKEEEVTRQLLELKSKALRAQMNPHFTFNVMNSIQHYILHNNKDAASKYMSKFSKLIRLILNHSEQNTISLAEEIKALELYIELEQIRFEENFEYSILVSQEVDANHWYVPSMLIQPYVENSIKHGILPLGTKGRLRIEFLKYNDLLKCVIEDNGIGRKRSAELKQVSEHTSLGTHITQERLEVMNTLYQTGLKENIIDLYDTNGISIGTRVEIYLSIHQLKPIN